MSSASPPIRIFLTLPDVLKTGIVEAEAVIAGDIAVILPATIPYGGEGLSWHRFRASANCRAREIRKAAVERLLVEIDQLNALDFGASSGGFRG